MSEYRIVYEDSPGGFVHIITPLACGYSVQAIGVKDVPEGKSFWIVPVEAMPTNKGARDSWRIGVDIPVGATPDGTGGASHEFPAEGDSYFY